MEIIGEILFYIALVIFYVVLLPLSFLVATPFVFLIPGKEICIKCHADLCLCGLPKVKAKQIGHSYIEIYKWWKRMGDYLSWLA